MSIKHICDSNYCTACFLCESVCPKGAINQSLNSLGEEIPAIDPAVCISCGRCVSICPANKIQELFRAEHCYAAWSKSNEDLEKSSSGGIAALLSRTIVNAGGVTYGAVSQDGKVEHKRVDRIDETDQLRGSKYVKSDNSKCYSKILDDLKTGRPVLFIGTPCQVSAVKSYIGMEYDNFIGVDLICHGTPPFSYLQEYLNKMCGSFLKRRKWDTVSFRTPNSYTIRAYSKGRLVYCKNVSDDLYFSAFLNRMILRENCYYCKYARPERIGDLTIGDFWGIDRNKLTTGHDGKISVILPNTKKGMSLLEHCEGEMSLYKLPIKDALNPKQGSLLHPSIPHKEREIFKRLYLKYGFTGALRRTDYGRHLCENVKRKNRKRTVVSPLSLISKIEHKLHR